MATDDVVSVVARARNHRNRLASPSRWAWVNRDPVRENSRILLVISRHGIQAEIDGAIAWESGAGPAFPRAAYGRAGAGASATTWMTRRPNLRSARCTRSNFSQRETPGGNVQMTRTS